MIKINTIKLMHGDCLIESDIIESVSVDLILTDLPYGNMMGAELDGWGKDKTQWDIAIEPKKVFEIANRILRKNGKMILFSQEPYTTRLISEASPNIPFSYRMIWEKDHFANSLIAKKAPVSYFEDVLVFSKNYEVGKDIIPDNPVYHYLQECRKKSGLSIKEFNYLYCDYVGKTKNRHRGMVARCWETSQFWVPTRDIYENVLQPTGFFPLPYEEIERMNKKELSTFNLWEGKKFKSNILKYKKDYMGLHPTQKPVLLLEDLIKTFSNENDSIVDLTMGSCSTGIACINTNRNFTGIELDDTYFETCKNRVNTYINDDNLQDALVDIAE